MNLSSADADAAAQDIGALLEDALPKGWAFVLLIAPPPAVDSFPVLCVSNLKKEAGLRIVREWVEKNT